MTDEEKNWMPDNRGPEDTKVVPMKEVPIPGAKVHPEFERGEPEKKEKR